MDLSRFKNIKKLRNREQISEYYKNLISEFKDPKLIYQDIKPNSKPDDDSILYQNSIVLDNIKEITNSQVKTL